MSKENTPLTTVELIILERFFKFTESQKNSWIIYLKIQTGEIKQAANDSVFTLQTIKKNRLNTLQNLPIGSKPLDKIDHLIINLSNAYSEITNDPVGLLNGITPQRYDALKSRLSCVIE